MKKRAFTLIEVLAVVSIIAIIATIGVYSVNVVLHNSRLKSLNNTSFVIKKSTEMYVVQKRPSNITLDLSPGATHNNLIGISEDPWGKEFQSIKVDVTKKTNKRYEYDVFIKINEGCYMLLDGEKQMREDPSCGASVPDDFAVIKSGTNYQINWENGFPPYKVLINNQIVGTTNEKTFTYNPVTSGLNPGTYSLQVQAKNNQPSATSNIIIAHELGGANTISNTAPGWSLSMAPGTAGTIDEVYDDALKKNVIEANLSLIASWGGYVRYNCFRIKPKPIFKTGATYVVKWKARLVNANANRTFSIRDSNSSNPVWNGKTTALTTSWQSFEETFVALPEGTGPLFYTSLTQINNPLRLSDLEIYNTTDISS